MPQLKNAVKSLAQDISVFLSRNLEKAIVIFRELLDQIRAVKYYKSKIPKSSKPRVNKASANKWQVKRKSKIVAACA
jgi:archaellum component FlaC